MASTMQRLGATMEDQKRVFRPLEVGLITFMLSTSSLRALKAQVPRRIQGRRFASHEPPQFNEPTGLLFGEKVRIVYCVVRAWTDDFYLFSFYHQDRRE